MKSKKLLFIGLDNAGKTAFINAMDKEYNDIQNLAPTVRVNRSKLEVLGIEIVRWDAGGQDRFRTDYLKEESKVLADADYVIYFIDVLDKERYSTSLNYLKDIIEAYQYSGYIPPFLVCIHKADPSFIDIGNEKKKMIPRWELKDDVVWLVNRLSEILSDTNFSTYLTSIYNLNSIQIAFTHVLRQIIPKLNLLEMINIILEEFTDSNNLLAASIVDRESLIFGEKIEDESIRDLFSATLMNGITFYENLQIVKPLYKLVINLESYQIIFTNFLKDKKKYTFCVMAMSDRDPNEILTEFEDNYFGRIHALFD
ncbi:MAG: hypothetical protein EU549_01255 [Promethearchaeota archaeon]|nr:MAG: hypothetical protein EU549_01255 [Candidatus Lokiarchaeota archaeon]